uniref:Uncharacterized protein n=1 Tax=Vitis vinifera TaxID=29760 RepID=F6GZB6_VITVI
MAKSRSFGSFFLAMVVILSLVCKEVVSQQDGRCCKDHPELGHCAPGKDDDPNGGKC